MSKTRGYLIADMTEGELEIVYVENPKWDFVEAGDEILVRHTDGHVWAVTAACGIQSHAADDATDEMLAKVLKIARKKSVQDLPRLIGTVRREYWYGDAEDEQDAE